MSIPLSLRYRFRQHLIPYSPLPIPPWHHGPGLSLYRDLRRSGISPSVIFDVGANIGQSAYAYRAWWPNAQIIAFEPVRTTYDTLEANLKGSGITCVQAACSDHNGEATIYIHAKSVAASLEHEGTGRQESIHCVTLDNYTSKHNIKQIDFLKIDVEGHEKSVFEGANQLFSQHRVRSILVETGFQEGVHVSLHDMRNILEPQGFELLAFHGQTLTEHGEQLHFANALFIHS